MATTSGSISELDLPIRQARAAPPVWWEKSLRHKIGANKEPLRGLWVVVLGPDGAGKSSVIEAIGDGIAAGFTQRESYHLRPQMFGGRRRVAPNRAPHAQTARSMAVTYLKFLYLLAANWLAYFGAVRPQVAQGKLVVFDRYFTDCLVDTRRYRIPTGTGKVAALVEKLMPQPDLQIVLDAPVDVLHGRKREVPASEVERQRQEYRQLAEELPNVVLVDAARPLAEVVDDVVEQVIERRLRMARERFEAVG
ncbi:MAG TPA: hypothetical protein VMT56_03840 [Candidatus Bathyarchaeia archaeon]|nr:hypothetical protein [Candidatus Bathyarchaeia archaeon]